MFQFGVELYNSLMISFIKQRPKNGLSKSIVQKINLALQDYKKMSKMKILIPSILKKTWKQENVAIFVLKKFQEQTKNQAKPSFQKLKLPAKNVEQLHARSMYILYFQMLL